MDIDNERYRYWREVQRTQLGVSANLYMAFASAVFGYTVNFLVTTEIIDCVTKVTLIIGIVFLLLSLIFYSWLTHNRLKDFRKTAQLFGEGDSEKEVGNKTSELGELSWNLYDFQRYSLTAGFIISLCGFSIFIYS